MLHGLQNLWDQQTYRDYYNKQIVHPCPLTKIMRLERTAWRRVTCSASNVSFFYSFILNQTAWPIEIQLKSSEQSVGRRMIYGGKDLWDRCVLSLEWKREEVMDGVMFVTDDE